MTELEFYQDEIAAKGIGVVTPLRQRSSNMGRVRRQEILRIGKIGLDYC